jgi:hypothetical protein
VNPLLLFGLIGAVGIVSILPLPEVVRAAVLIVALIVGSFAGWLGSMKRRRFVSGTPTSKVATAAKGYTELRGRARNAVQKPLYDPITDNPCVWFQVRTEQFDFGKLQWKQIGSARSSRPFALEDETGLCLVVPGWALLMVGEPVRVRQSMRIRHSIERILEGQHLYAIGHLERIDGPEEAPRATAALSLDFERRVSLLMREWKSDKRRRDTLLDANKDGVIDDAEIERARELARAEVRRRLPQQREVLEIAPTAPSADATAVKATVYAVGDRPVTHWMRSGADDRPHIVSSLGEKAVIAKERRAGCLYLAVFIVVTIGALVALLVDR